MTTSWAGEAPVDGERRMSTARAYEALARVVQDLSLTRDLQAIMEIVRTSARELTGADGASFILREGELCHYAEEDAIAPLWRGRRFPIAACISGWVIVHHQGVAIEDVYADPRVPSDAYRPTFVKSLAMVPIRTKAPMGAIGSYWAAHHLAAPDEMAILQALADSTSVAMESIAIRADLEQRVRDRTAELEAARDELRDRHDALLALHRQKEALSALVVHDLKTPAAAISLSASMQLKAAGLSGAERRRWTAVLSSAEQIHRTALCLLDIADSDEGRLAPNPAAIDAGALLAGVRELFAPQAESRGQAVEIHADVAPGALHADADLLRRVLQNLVENALQSSPRGSTVRVEARVDDGAVELAVADEGAGVPRDMRDRIFDRYFQLGEADRSGGHRGLGLSFCRLAVEAHGGAIWIEDAEPRGSRFCFRIPSPPGRMDG